MHVFDNTKLCGVDLMPFAARSLFGSIKGSCALWDCEISINHLIVLAIKCYYISSSDYTGNNLSVHVLKD